MDQHLKEALYAYSASNSLVIDSLQPTVETLINIIQEAESSRLAFKAAWVLEHRILKNHQLLQQNIVDIQQVYVQQRNWSVLRSLSKVLMEAMKLLDDEPVTDLDELIIAHSFNLLVDYACPIALRCNLYDILFLYNQKQPWIAQELLLMIRFELEKNDSPAIISRGKRLIRKLERIS